MPERRAAVAALEDRIRFLIADAQYRIAAAVIEIGADRKVAALRQAMGPVIAEALADLDEIKGNKSLQDSRVGETLAECWWTGCVCSQSKRLAALADLTEYEGAVLAAELAVKSAS